MAFMTGLSARLWAYLAAAGAVLALAWRIVAGIQKAERDRIAARQAEVAQQQRTARDEIDRSVARADDPAGELRRDWRRGRCWRIT